MKPGDTVLCISSGTNIHITEGHSYKVVHPVPRKADYIRIVNDKGSALPYAKRLFTTPKKAKVGRVRRNPVTAITVSSEWFHELLSGAVSTITGDNVKVAKFYETQDGVHLVFEA